MQRPIALACTLALSTMALAQEQECPMALDAELAAAHDAQRAAGAYDLPAFAKRGVYYVPLTFHVVRRDDGSGGLSQARLDTAVEDANEMYAPIGIQFCLTGVYEIWSDFFYYEIDSYDDINAMRTTNPVPNTINIYFTEILNSGSSSLCGTSAFTFSSVQAIAMKNSCTASSTNHSTFPHEIGHYFDLFHTHEPFYGPECVDGSNCATAADLICDTPADPNLSGNVNGGCFYTGQDVDQCHGAPFEPDTRNLMSYSRKNCRDHFSQGQLDKALATLLNLRPELALLSCASDCLADWDGNGQFLSNDFIAYLNDYNLVRTGQSPVYGDPDLASPFDVLNTADLLAYLNLYTAGCE